jgi:hypothetical protein
MGLILQNGAIPRHILREGQLAAKDEAHSDDEGTRTVHEDS